MKAARLTGIRQVRIDEVAGPGEAGPGEVVVRVEVVGVCGSDMHYYRTGRIGSQVVQYPFTVGHECAGTVVAVGPAAPEPDTAEHGSPPPVLAVGDRVAVDPLIACGQCDQCLAGRENTCRRQRFLGCPGQAEGALSEFLILPARCCFPIPDTMTFVQATLAEPFAIGLYAYRLWVRSTGETCGAGVSPACPAGILPARIGEMGRIGEAGLTSSNAQPNGTHNAGETPAPRCTPAPVLILGCGPIGLSVLAAVKADQPERPVYVTDLRDNRLAMARRMGADWGGNPRQLDLPATLRQECPLGFAAAFECAGEQETIDHALDLLAPGGRLMLVGIPEADRVALRPDVMRRKELALHNVRRQNHCAADAIELIAAGAVNLDAMVTHEFDFAQTGKAFELVADYADDVVKAMIFLKKANSQ